MLSTITYACLSEQGLLLISSTRLNLSDKENNIIQYFFVRNSGLIVYLQNKAHCMCGNPLFMANYKV